MRVGEHVERHPGFFFWRPAGGVFGARENCYANLVLVLFFPGTVVGAPRDAARLRLQGFLLLR